MSSVPVTLDATLVDLPRPSAAHGIRVLAARRIRLTTRTASGVVGQLLSPILWVLIVGPALADSLGSFNAGVDYFTYVAVGQVAFLIPFTAMFSGLNVIVDREFGILREVLVAPVRRWSVPIAEALAVLAITLVQVALIVGLGRLRGAHFHTSPARLPWFVAAAALLCLAVYGVAEILALRIGRQEVYGSLIPAIGVTPYFLSGALYPLSVLPAGIEQVAYLLPWTHAVALMRYGLMEGDPSGLTQIWHITSEPLAAALSLGVLTVMAGTSLLVATRVFLRATTT
jgi:ABC-2 type transport system permease protein